MIKYNRTPEFEKDFKALCKRFRSLDEDLNFYIKYSIEPYYLQQVNNNSFVPIQNGCTENCVANKVRKFACKSLVGKGSRTGIRIIFVWEKKTMTVHFVEIYYKSDQENEDKNRLRNFIKELEEENEN